jgi:hypothetical protein
MMDNFCVTMGTVIPLLEYIVMQQWERTSLLEHVQQYIGPHWCNCAVMHTINLE